MAKRDIVVQGAGIIGLWQALILARAGHRVRLCDTDANPFANNASRFAGAMLAPDCEAEAAPPLVHEFGQRGLELWRSTYPDLINAGSLVVAGARDRADLLRFRKLTSNHTVLNEEGIKQLEPDLGDRFSDALHFSHEAHMVTPDALAFLLNAVRTAGAEIQFGDTSPPGAGQLVVDCRGMAARGELPTLRGVRGERILIHSDDVKLNRPVRLLHPRHPIYIVPWSNGRFLVGATMIESEDAGPASVRSALELLGAAYALHPAFGEAEILDIGAGVRPAFPDNVPRAVMGEGGRRIYVNGAYRHGYLLAPVLAEAVAAFIERGVAHTLLTMAKG